MFKRLLVLSAIFTSILSANNIPQGFTKIKELGGITEYKLESNGLSVLLMEDHSAPVLTCLVTYRVGSRNEVTGNTGSTHLLEHLMFKGTEKFNKANGGHIDAKLGDIGARLNATTWLDRTNYYETIPNDYLELTIDIESDRMRNLLLKKEDKESEMTVVRNEYERGENSPFSALNTAIWASAFVAHPYHHPTIGWKSDIENVPIEDLRAFYNTFYWPNNATVTVIGDFKTVETLELLKKYFGQIPASPQPIPQIYTTESEQQGARRVQVKRAGQLGVVGIAHKVPEGSHADFFPLAVLDKLLTEGKTSILYKSLIDQGKAVNIFNFAFPFRDPSLFVNYAFLAPEISHEEVENIILNELEKVKTEGVSEDEVNRAINQITAETAYERDGSFSIASQLNEAIALGDWTSFVTYLDNIKKVTPSDIQRVVKKYFVEQSRTTGYFVPKTAGGDAEMTSTGKRAESQTMNFYRNPEDNSIQSNSSPVHAKVNAKPTSIAENIKDKKVEGIRVLTAKTSVKDVVTFRGSFAAGDHFSPAGNSTIADLTGNILDKGTIINNKFVLAEKLENMGASIAFSVSTHKLEFNGKCLKKDVNTVIGLLAEQLRSPAFNQEEFEKLKVQKIGSWKQLLENTDVRADEKTKEMLFPKDHPNRGVSVSKLIEDVKKASLMEVKEFHKKYYGPKSMIFVLVGDIDEKEIVAGIQKSFSGWKGGIDYPEYNLADYQSTGKTEIIPMEDKTSATLEIAQITKLKSTDPEYIAFSVANEALGGGSFTARLLSIVRDDEGLTYGIYSNHSDDLFCDGLWAISGTFSPNLLAQGYQSTMRELKRWVKDGLTNEELESTKSRIIGSYKVSLETTNGVARQILRFAEKGLDASYLDKFPQMVKALSLEEVNNSIKKFVDPEKVITVVAGTVTEENLMPKK
ncbi:MAG: insulinase family protein [Ignavibacteriae bacterium HGW-Ignavibacteriae-2]|jgi:zinc protease|nr:MAG: insulinase family protein [Ignavibacteriae bacterium HGW-Ignavibacteriae-2]